MALVHQHEESHNEHLFHQHEESHDERLFETFDFFNNNGERFKWSQPNGKGSQIDLTYSFENDFRLNGLSENESKTLFQEALSIWAKAAPLNFKEIKDPGNDQLVDIRAKSENIDGNGGTLGFAFFPQGGDITFDSGERSWSPSLFLETAVHEIGHSLGLGHDNGVEAIMNSSIQGRFNGPGTAFLLQDDIDGVRSLYGSGRGVVSPLGQSPNPNPAPNPNPNPIPDPIPNPGPNPNPEFNLIKGDEQNNRLTGSRNQDRILGLGGNDLIRAGAEDDQLLGGEGRDSLLGQRGDDTLLGQAGRDRLIGGIGDDSLAGGSDRDILIGGTGNDALVGGSDRDVLIGTRQMERMPGTGEIDTLSGGRGADTFVLGNKQSVFYTDGTDLPDYAVVTDFDARQGDVLRLKGQASDYSLGTSSIRGLPDGLALVQGRGANRELVAMIKSATNFSLNSSAVKFV